MSAAVAELADARDLKSSGSDTRTGSIPVRGTNINFVYVGTIYRMKMLIELVEVNQFFVFKFKIMI